MIVESSLISRLMDMDVVLYARPIKMEWVGGNGLGWRLTAEKIGLPFIYITIEEPDLEDGLSELVKIVADKLNITKTPKRARRKR